MRKKTKNRHGGFGLQVLLLMLMLLVGGGSPAWANTKYSWNETANDEGGGSFTCKGETESWGFYYNIANYYKYLKTTKHFSLDDDQFNWEFEIRVNFKHRVDTGSDIWWHEYDGKIYVVTADDVKHEIATWKKKKESLEITTSNTNTSFGQVNLSEQLYSDRSLDNSCLMKLQYAPTAKAVNAGVKRIVVYYTMQYYQNFECNGWVQYEKALDFSTIAVDKPLPKPTVGWGTDGKLAFKAAGMPDKRNNKLWDNEYYSLNAYYNKDGNKTGSANYGTKTGTVSYANETNGKMDMSFSYWPADGGAYTVPVYVKTQGHIQVKPNGTNAVTYDQPEAGSVLVKPYTRPMKVWVDYDQWNMKATIHWSRQEKAAGYDGSRAQSVECLTDGQWYVVRYETTQGVANYEVVKDISGKSTSLQVVDDKIDYDKKYTYRVIFLPDILKSGYKDRLASLPGQSASHSTYDLWEQVELQTTFSAPVKLSHDKSETEKIHLTWEYNIPLSGLKWSVESRSAGSSNSWTEEQQLSLDPNKHTAEVRLAGSACDPKEYRVSAMINNRQVCSDILGASLPSSTYISDVQVTTGTEEQKVVVRWKVESPDTEHDIYYRVLRRIVGETDWVTLSSSTHGTFNEYEYTDDRPQAGTYYEYAVQAFGALCDEQLKQSDMIVKPGFAQARGTITGHIAFGSGTAVQGVRVSLVRATAEQEGDRAQYFSRYIEDEGTGLLWQGDPATYAGLLNGKQPLTLQLWAKPASDGSSQMSLVTLNGALQLGVKRVGTGYCLFAADLSGGNPANYTVKEYPALTFSDYDFTHVTAVYDGQKQWTFYVGTDSLLTGSLTVANNNWKAIPAAGTNTLAVGGSNQAVAGTYKGFVDDIRLWTRALKSADVESNYTRILGGTEDGLRLYWPLDEGEQVRQYAFDIACQDGIYQLNHPEVGANAVPRREVPRLLTLYGMTDSEGDYIIKGIPFQQGGTNYKIVPELGIHEFSPGTRSMFVSPTSLTANNIDFEDVSCFPMEGYIYYAGTNIPVEGAMFYVDGMVQSREGQLIRTDETGYYSMSVPIGKHYVEARLDGHTMVDGGRFPLKDTYDFNGSVTHDFSDATLVNFVGRVGGGERNDTLAVGFGKSKNNIGMATIMLRLNNEKLMFNCQDDHLTSATTQRVWQSDTTAVNSRSWTGTGADAKYITIRTDSLTGEFSALLPPLKYIVKSVAIPSNSDIEFTTLPEVDLTNPQNELADTLVQVGSSGAEEKVPYHYVAKKVFTHFAQPQLDVTEYANGQPNAKGVYGIKDIDIPQATGETLKVRNLWTVEDNNVSYLLDYPVYNMNETVEYHFFAYEAYYNRDASTEVADIIPLDGQQLTIANEMSAEQSVVCTVDDESSGYKAGDVYELKTNKLDMDYNGEGILRWKVGKPNISSPYTRHFGISLQKDGRTHNVGGVDAIVLGALPVGSNFVTKGPDEVKFVLRDPPGAKSKTTLTKGKVTTTSKMNTKLDYGDTQILNNVISGGSLTSATGVGFMVITEQEIKNQFDWGTHVEWEEDYTSGESTVTTTFEEISTSDEAPYIGPDGDVFVGTSTNFLVGTCRQLLIKQDPTTKKYALALEEALSLDQKVSTAFRYSQYEIENVMIPKWEDMRRSYLQRVSSQGEAEGYAGSDGKTAYLTWIDQTDPNYGKESTYYWYRPPKQEESEVDSVMWCTNQINSWKSVLAKNEKQKVEAIRGGNLENYSIDGGSSYTYSLRNEHIEVNDTVKTWRMGLLLGEHFGFKASAAIAAGMIVNIDFEAGGGEASQNTTETNNFSEWTYVLNDGNVDADLSINVFKSSDKSASDIFYLYGGQTYNPYEGAEVTHYYEPGTALGNATEQMEQPMLSISSGGNTPSKNITLTDIPAGQEANLTLHCTNMARVHQGTDFSYDVVVVESANKNGLQILMDGVPISGRSILLPQSETVTKQITIRQTDQSLLDYEGIKLRFCSQYEPEDIYDEVTLNAHFKPSSSPIDLAIQEPVLNNDREDGILDMKLTNFNRQFKNLKNVGVQYRFQGNTQWTDLFTWWVNPTDTIGRDTVSNALLPESGDLLYAAKMKSNLSFPEGDYQFRAFTTTPYGTELVSVYSDVITVIKDMSSPRSLYTPAPANGILSYGDQLAIEFNEDIVPGYVGDDNVIVTAKLNNSEVNHDVAYQIIPFFDMPRTVNPVFLKGDFAMDFWLNWHDPGTILHQGAGTDNFALGIDDAGHVKVTIAKAQFVSTDTVPKDEWVFFALSYNAAKMTFDILAQYGTTTVDLFENEPVTAENKQVVNYASDNHLYLGHIWADMHGLSLYNICHDVHEAAATKYQAKDNYIYGLANYWPMDEGHGSVAADTRHTHDFTVYDSWTLNNRNYSLRINKPEGAQADITRVGTGQGDSYAIEMWYNKSGAKDEVVFETATPTVDGDLLAEESKLRLRYDSVQSIVLDYGKKSMVVASHEDFPDLRRWHHVALNVVRGQAASFYLDGQRTAVIAERDVPPIEGSRLIVGKGNEIQAFADEVRIWHAALSESRLLRNIYNTIDTADVYSRGLVAYYPFEKTGEENGETTKVATMENMAPNLSAGAAKEIIFDKDNLHTHTPPLKNAPDETKLIASPVASERKVVINLTGAGISPRDIEGTTLNVTVDRVHDLHGNTSLPIRWTAYVQQNTLKWTKDSVNIIKKYGDSHTFDVTIENKSGNTEYYTLYNMPQWLTVVGSSASDEVSPLSTKVLRFQVNPLVPVGNYEVTIGVQGNNQILEPLRVVMKVRGEKPQWTVDPTLYEHQMNYIGQVRIGGILIENSESMVAAFIDGECRGVASPKQVRGAAYVTMTVYGNGDTDAGKPISFRIWDASAGIAYTDVNITAFNGSPVDNTFQLNAVRGSFDQPVIWTKGTDVEQNLKLTKNWNWVALGVRPADQRPAAVFPLLTPWNVFIKDKASTMIFCDGNNWMPEDARIQAATMYKVKITPVVEGQQLPEQVPVTGEQLKLSKTPVTLTPGWNWIGYTPLTTMTLGQALAAANPQVGDCVKSQHGIAFYSLNGWEGSLEVMESGHGYMYNSTASEEKSFVYPDATGTNRVAARRTLLNAESQSESQKTRLFAPTVGNYPDNMSMVIALKDGEQSVDTCEVAAYIGGECRGATRANGGLYYLIIAGEGSGQPLELRTCINGEMVVIDNTQTYISDVNIGTPWNPYVIDLSEIRTGISTIAADDADDDSDWWTLQGFKIGRKPTQPGVYIHRGEKVVVKRKK